MKLSIAYLTNRKDPCFHWFADSLANQIQEDDDIEVMVIDLLYDYEPADREQYYDVHRRDEFDLSIRAPKPCNWQGKHRKTTEDMFAAANARNTAFIYANSPYIFCVDDLSCLSPNWLDAARHAADGGYVMCGAYKKLKEMVVDNGTIVSHGEEIKDSRWDYGSDDGIREIQGNMLFGCSFGLPLEAAIRVNGFDEYHDGLGAEDCDFGTRLNRAGFKTYYNRNALTCESYEHHFQAGTFTRRNRKSFTGEDVDWYMVNRLREQRMRFTTLGQWTNIEKMREVVKAKGAIPPEILPKEDWATKLPFDQVFSKEKERR